MYRCRSPLIALCVLLGACSPQIRMSQDPIAGSVADYGWIATAPDGVSVTIHTVLTRNDPGSWARDAGWDEYIITVKNSSPSSVQVTQVQLYSPYFPSGQQSSLSRPQLEKASRETLQAVRDVTLVAGAGAFAVGTTVAVAGSSAVVAATAPVVGVVVLGAVDSQLQQSEIRRNRERQDESLIELTILERGIHLPLTVPAGRQTIRSAFFPLTPAPNRLLMNYRANDESRVLQLDLPALAQLHIKSDTTSH